MNGTAVIKSTVQLVTPVYSRVCANLLLFWRLF